MIAKPKFMITNQYGSVDNTGWKSTIDTPYGQVGTTGFPLSQSNELDLGGGGSSSSSSSSPNTVNFHPNDLSSLFMGQRNSSVGNLQNLLGRVNRGDAIKKALSDYDALYASTKASGFQAANNAGNTYANRLMQQGINPTASGVVTAQAKLPVYGALNQISQEKSATRLDAAQKSDALSAQIASMISNIQLSYSKTLADYNTSQNSQQLNAGEFNATAGFNTTNANRDYQLKLRQLLDNEKAAQQAAMLANQKAGGAPGIVPNFGGYITNSGPLNPSSGSSIYNPTVSVGNAPNGTMGVPFFTPPSY